MVAPKTAGVYEWAKGLSYVRSTGNLGIGTYPHDGARLHVQGTGTQGVLLPSVALTDAITWAPVAGSATDGMIVYNTATSGSGTAAVSPGYYYWRQGRWRRVSDKSAVLGTLSGASTSLTTTAPDWQYMNAYIDLPPGTWIVSVTQLLACGSMPDNASLWVRSTFSEGVPWAGFSPDIVGSSLASGVYVGPSVYSILTGQIVIRNASSTVKRYYYYAHKDQLINTTCNPANIGTSLQGENQLFAIPAD